jgi:calcineurin-like phosphoesterase family protein
MATWIESDTHYYHANIIRYVKRPYIRPGDLDKDGAWVNKAVGAERATEMTEKMIADHNALVKPDDEVIHLGDFCFGGTQNVIRLLRRLNGKYKFIWGNHDKPLKDFATVIDYYPDLKDRIQFLGGLHEIQIEGQQIVLCHYAMRTWNKSHRGAWHLYGHSHGTLPDDPNSMSFDVGVDCHGLKPVSIDQIRAIMAKKTFKPVDHHGSKSDA